MLFQHYYRPHLINSKFEPANNRKAASTRISPSKHLIFFLYLITSRSKTNHVYIKYRSSSTCSIPENKFEHSPYYVTFSRIRMLDEDRFADWNELSNRQQSIEKLNCILYIHYMYYIILLHFRLYDNIDWLIDQYSNWWPPDESLHPTSAIKLNYM